MLLGSAVAGYAWTLRAQRRQLERLLDATGAKLQRLQRQFECFVPSDLVERLTDVGDELKPARRYVTILFADLRGFTAMSDGLDPAVTVAVVTRAITFDGAAVPTSLFTCLNCATSLPGVKVTTV